MQLVIFARISTKIRQICQILFTIKIKEMRMIQEMIDLFKLIMLNIYLKFEY